MVGKNKTSIIPPAPADLEKAPPPKMELEVLANNLEFRWNFIEVKAAIVEAVKKYEGLVVTENNLADMERTQKEIAALRLKLNSFRIETKKLLNKPADEFDGQVKELTAVIEAAEQPLKDQLAKYEEARVAKRIDELAAYAKEYADGRGLRPENFKYEVPAKLTNRTVSDKAAKQDVAAAIDELLAKQGADDEAAAEARKKEDDARILREQRDLMITILCKTQSAFLQLKTPVTQEDILQLITPETPVLDLPVIIETECKKRKQVELAAAPAPVESAAPAEQAQDWHCPENCKKVAAYGYQCPDDLGGKDDPCPLGIIGAPPPRRMSFGPPPPVAVAPTPLFVVVLRFPRISKVNAGALQMWLDQAKIPFEVVSQEHVKGDEQ